MEPFKIVELEIKEGLVHLKDGPLVKVRPLGKPQIFHNYETDKTLFENISQNPKFLDISRDDLGNLELECLGVVIGEQLKWPLGMAFSPCYPVQFYVVAGRDNGQW